MAKHKVINTVLNLRDNMSKGFLSAVKNTQGLSKEMKDATRKVEAFRNKAGKSIDAFAEKLTSAAGKAVKWSAVTVGALAAVAAKTGFSEALDLEGYRLQLETATKDTQKAADIMQYAIDLANKTPFEGGELVEGAAKFESMGMSATEWLKRTGDMSAATNKSFDQAVEALIDAQTGELERLKEFGITKAMILKKGETMFSDVQIANNNGQIVNLKKFNEALVGLMQDKYAGGMEKMATTTKGMWSTITGVAKSGLSTIVGMSADGSIRTGSALDLIKSKVSGVAAKFEEWQNDGTLDGLATKFDTVLSGALDIAGRAFDYIWPVVQNVIAKIKALKDDGTIDHLATKLKDVLAFALGVARNAFTWLVDHKELVAGALKVIGVALVAVKFAQFAAGAVKAYKTVHSFMGAVGKFVSANPIVLIIAAVVAAIALLIANWDNIKAAASALWEKVQNTWESIKEKVGGVVDTVQEKFTAFKDKVADIFGGIKDAIVNAFRKAKEGVKGFFDWIGRSLSWLNEKIEGIPILGGIYKSFKSGASTIASGAKSAVQWIGDQLSGNALGTGYWRGGLTRVHERGGEILNLPSGTQIIPHDISRRMATGKGIMVQVTIQGNVIGNHAYAEEMGGYLAKKVLAALDNT